MLSAEELLAGSALTYELDIPESLMGRSGTTGEAGQTPGATSTSDRVRLRPLTVRDLQLIARAAHESDSLTAALMVKTALVEPQLDIQQVMSMPAGLLEHLLRRVNEISGIDTQRAELAEAADAPLAKAAFVLAREFGWTPEQVNQLTLGQVLLHLEMLRLGGSAH